MAATAANGPPPSKARPHTLAGTRALKATAGPLNRAANQYKHLDLKRIAADLQHYPQQLVDSTESAARKKGYGSQVDFVNRKVGGFQKWHKDINYEPYPAKEKGIPGALDRGLWEAHHWYGKVKDAAWFLQVTRIAKNARTFLGRHFSLIDVAWNALATIKDIRNKDWRRAKFHAAMTAFYAFTRNWTRKGWTYRAAMRALEWTKTTGARLGLQGIRWMGQMGRAAWQGARGFVTEKAAPWASRMWRTGVQGLRSGWGAARGFVTEKALPWASRMLRTGAQGIRSGWGAARGFVTEKALPWASRMLRTGVQGIRSGWGAARGFVTEKALPWAGRMLRTGWGAARGFVTEKAIPWVTERAIPWVTERALPWAARIGARLAPRLFMLGESVLPRLGPWGLAAAVALAAIAGGIYAYKHPKETKQFFHKVGGFFHNVGVDMFGTAKQKAKSGWHPWADLTASTIGLGRDVLNLDPASAWKDMTGAYHAANKITGAELPPGVKRPPPPPPKSWQEKGWGFVRNVVIPSIPLLGDSLGDTIDQGSELWRMYKQASKASQPRGPVSASRITTRLHAPPAVRSPRPRPQSANNHSKTQAEIRVRFENAPPGTKLGTRVTGGESSIFQTGLAFAN